MYIGFDATSDFFVQTHCPKCSNVQLFVCRHVCISPCVFGEHGEKKNKVMPGQKMDRFTKSMEIPAHPLGG